MSIFRLYNASPSLPFTNFIAAFNAVGGVICRWGETSVYLASSIFTVNIVFLDMNSNLVLQSDVITFSYRSTPADDMPG